MPPTTSADTALDEHLAEIEDCLREIRQDVSRILHCVQEELDAFREREFWRDNAQFYKQE